MKFLANENVSLASIKLLRSSGFEVISISEEMGGASDELVLNRAVNEELIILTFDRDYGELIFKYKLETPPAIVYFRLKNDLPEDSGKILLNIINNADFQLKGNFTVIEDDNIRQRKL